MPYYCVNTEAQANGDHEVHDTSACNNLPSIWNRKDLGYHSSCVGAVREAKKTYWKANGCWHCCRSCHTT